MSPASTLAPRDERDLVARCLARDPKALRILERDYIDRTDGALVALRLGSSDRDEVRQELWVRLLIGENPRLAMYEGRGELLGFIRAVAVRLAIDVARRQKRSDDEAVLLGMADPSDGPELAVTKRVSRAQFRSAFEAALASLAPKQRTLLRQVYVDGLSNEAVAHLHGLHRTTVFRWTIEARRLLATCLRRELAASLRVAVEDVPMFAAFLRSELSLSLERVLA